MGCARSAPLDLVEVFGNLPPPFSQKLDAIAMQHRSSFLLFSKDQVLQWAIQEQGLYGRRLMLGPMSKHPSFQRLPAPFATKIDACVCISHTHGTLLLFSGDMVVQMNEWSIETPMALKEHPLFSELPPPFSKQIDAAACIDRSQGRLLLFSGGEVMTYSCWPIIDPGSSRVLVPPQPTGASDRFAELPPPFNAAGGGVGAAVCVSSLRAVAAGKAELVLFGDGKVCRYAGGHDAPAGARLQAGPVATQPPGEESAGPAAVATSSATVAPDG